MRPLLLRLGSELRLAQRLACQQRMMGYEAQGNLTVREKAVMWGLDMDSLPVPSGDWATEYNRVQRNYNIHLLVSALLFTGTVFYFVTNDYVKIPDITKPLNLEEFYQARLAQQKEEE